MFGMRRSIRQFKPDETLAARSIQGTRSGEAPRIGQAY
jgi:hypothetical protein